MSLTPSDELLELREFVAWLGPAPSCCCGYCCLSCYRYSEYGAGERSVITRAGPPAPPCCCCPRFVFVFTLAVGRLHGLLARPRRPLRAAAGGLAAAGPAAAGPAAVVQSARDLLMQAEWPKAPLLLAAARLDARDWFWQCWSAAVGSPACGPWYWILFTNSRSTVMCNSWATLGCAACLKLPT